MIQRFLIGLALAGLALNLNPAHAQEDAVRSPLSLESSPFLSVSVLDGWDIYFSTPIFVGSDWIWNTGLTFHKQWRIGPALGFRGNHLMKNLALGFSTQVSSPLSRPQFNLSPGLSLNQHHRLGPWVVFYGLNYNHLYRFNWQNQFDVTGLQGLLGSVGLQLNSGRYRSYTLGVQAGYYSPYFNSNALSSSDGFWVVQPILGGQLRF